MVQLLVNEVDLRNQPLAMTARFTQEVWHIVQHDHAICYISMTPHGQ